MESAYSIARKQVTEALRAAAAKISTRGIDIGSTVGMSKELGDISSSIAFRIAKERRGSPNGIAEELAKGISKPECVAAVSAEKGFVNFHLDKKRFAKLVLSWDAGAKSEKEGRVIVEYPSVNPNKPWHIGHLRNALLGDSVSKTFDYIGYSVEREDYIDDLGLQMAETLWWRINSADARPTGKFDHWLGEEYVKANEHMDEGSKSDIQKTMALMSQDGTYESTLLRELVTECIRAQRKTASDYRVFHDIMVWESDILGERILEKAMALMVKYGFVKKPDSGEYANCTVIDLDSIENLTDDLKGLKERMKVLVRSDGNATYLAKDIAFHMWKLGMLEDTFRFSVFMTQDNGTKLMTTGKDGNGLRLPKADMAINIIDIRQSHPQSVLRAVFGAMEGNGAGRIRHLAYGEVELESGALSGRKGTWMGFSADDLIREAENEARKRMSGRFNFSEAEEKEAVNSIALSAIKFEFLRMSPERRIVFSWAKALNFEGDSGPYAQYMHARATRILEEAPKELLRAEAAMDGITDHEFKLLKLLSMEWEIAEKAARELRPNTIAEYVNDLAHGFSSFYENSPILKADSDNDKIFRLKVAGAFKGTMKRMLGLLGIEAIERM